MLAVSRSEHRSNFHILQACGETHFSRLRHPNRIVVLQEAAGVLPIPRANGLGCDIRLHHKATDRKVADSVPQRLRETLRIMRRFLNGIMKNLIKNCFGIWRPGKTKLNDDRINEGLGCIAQISPIENIFRLSGIRALGRLQLEIFRVMC